MKRRGLKIILVLLAIALVALVLYETGFVDLITDLQALQSFITSLGFLGALVFILIFVVAAVFLLPGSLLVMASGILYGPWWGTLISLIASTIAASLSFLIARGVGRKVIIEKFSENKLFLKIESGVQKNGIDFLIFTRLMPFSPYNIQNYAYGLTSISFTKFTLISMVSMIPGTFLFAFLAGQFVNNGIDWIFIAELCGGALILFGIWQLIKYIARKRHVEIEDDDEIDHMKSYTDKK